MASSPPVGADLDAKDPLSQLNYLVKCNAALAQTIQHLQTISQQVKDAIATVSLPTSLAPSVSIVWANLVIPVKSNFKTSRHSCMLPCNYID